MLGNDIQADKKNILFVVIIFSTCMITYFIFRKKLSLAFDAIMNIISQTSLVFTYYDLEQATKNENEFAGMAALLIPAFQSIQIISVVDKIVDHEGWVNKVLIWCGTLFLDLFLGFTVQVYREEHLAGIFLIMEAGVIIFATIYAIYKARSNWTFLFVWFATLFFTNPVCKYLWAYGIGFFAESIVFALILTIPVRLKIYVMRTFFLVERRFSIR